MSSVFHGFATRILDRLTGPTPDEVLAPMRDRNQRLGHLFRNLRVHLELSLRDAAVGLNIDALTLAEYERGVRAPKSWDALFRALLDIQHQPDPRPQFTHERDTATIFGLVLLKLGMLNKVIKITERELLDAMKNDYQIVRRDGDRCIEFCVRGPAPVTTVNTSDVTPNGTSPSILDIEHNKRDPLDFARQWFYSVIKQYEDKSGTSITVSKTDDNKTDWTFIDTFLPMKLAELISPATPSTKYIESWLKIARRRKAESMKSWRERLRAHLGIMFNSTQLEERRAVLTHIENLMKELPKTKGGPTAASMAIEAVGVHLEDLLRQIHDGKHRKTQ